MYQDNSGGLLGSLTASLPLLLVWQECIAHLRDVLRPIREGSAQAQLAVKPQCAHLDREDAGVSLVLVAHGVSG